MGDGSLTTAELRAHIEREKAIGEALAQRGQAFDQAQVVRAWSDVEQFALPISLERDRLVVELDRQRVNSRAREALLQRRTDALRAEERRADDLAREVDGLRELVAQLRADR